MGGLLARLTVNGIKLGVKAAQMILVSYGLDVAIDGVWGKITQQNFFGLGKGKKESVEKAASDAGLPVPVLQSLQANPREIGDIELEIVTTAHNYGIEGKSLANLMGIIAVESGFKPQQELHTYSPTRAREVFSSLRSAKDDQINLIVASGPEVFFETVYGKGTPKGDDLGNVQKGDGAKYRGRGLFQLTGRGVYSAFERDSGWPVVSQPDLLLKPEVSIDSAFWYWRKFVVARGADKDVTKAVKVVNPGIINVRGELRKRVAIAKSYEVLV